MHEGRPLPLLSVIIPVWNGADYIAGCLEALSAQTLSKSLFEVIVVDNGSTDGTREILSRFEDVAVILEEIPGSYAARNAGLAIAKGELLLFTDADCTPASDWCEVAVEAAKSAAKGVIAGRIELFADAGECGPLAYEGQFSFNQKRSVELGVAATANWLTWREVLGDVGVFRADLKSGGDGELTRRIGSAGYSVTYNSSMVVTHPTRGKYVDLAAKRRRVIGGLWQKAKLGGKVALFAKALYWGLREVALIMQSEKILAAHKLPASRVAVQLASTSIAELLRLACGGAPRRA